MKHQLTFRIFSILAVLSLMMSAVGMPNFSTQAATTITIDGTVPSPQTFTSTSSNAVTFTNAPTGTGSNRLMLVGISWNSGSNAITINSVVFTYGSTDLSLTQVISQKHSGQNRYTAIWQLVNPPSGQTGSVKVTFNGQISNGIVVGVINFAGVDQSTPLDTAVGTSGGTGTSDVTTPSITVESLSGTELIFESLMIGGNPPTDPSPTAGQTMRWEANISNARGEATTLDANGNTSVNLTWSDVTGYWVQAAVAINPASVVTYNLTMEANPVDGGTTVPAVGGPYSYPENQVVNIEAHPNVGYVFTSWSGGVANPSSASTTVTMDANKTITANFTAQNYDLTMAVDPAGAGTTTPAVGPHSYGAGAVVDISASAAAGYTFDHWVGNVADPNSAATTVTMNGNQNVTAVFSSLYVDGAFSSGTGAANATSVTFSHTTGTGSNRLTLVGVSWNCGSTDTTINSVTFSYGSPQTDLELDEVITQKVQKSATENRYAAIYSLLNPPSGQSGTISINFSGAVSSGIVAGAINFAGVDQTTPFDSSNGASGNDTNANVTLTGLNGDELVFDNVFQGGSSSSQTLTAGSGQSRQWHQFAGNALGTASVERASGSSVAMSWTATESSYWAIAAVPINPAPTATTYNLTMAVDPAGAGTTTPPVGVYPYAAGTVVNISANAALGYEFDHWSENVASPSSASTTVIMDADKKVTAYFKETTVTGTATSSATPSDAAPGIGEQITVDIIIDVTDVDPPNNYLGSFTATLDWDPAVLSYDSNSGLKAGFTGVINTSQVASGHITFNGANPSGATGEVEVFTITFNVVAAGTSALDLDYSAMAAAYTYADLLPILTVNDGQVIVTAPTEIHFTGEELLGRPTDSSISIKVLPDVDISLYYEYGTTSGNYTNQTATTSASAGQPKTVVIDGLDANTKYYYRMQYSADGGSSWIARPEHSFQTQRAEGSTFTFTITSDSHVNILLGNATTWTNTLSDVAKDNPDFHLDLGDTFAMRSVSAGDVAGAEAAYKFQLPFFNKISHSAPIFLVPGNHEQQEAWHLIGDLSTSLPVIGTNAQKKFFLNPVPNSFYSGDTNTYEYLDGDQFREDYYAWTWGDALFVVINPYWYSTTKPYVTDPGGGEDDTTGSGDAWDWTLGKEQFDWLKETLSNSDAEYKFIFAHQMVSDSSLTGQEDYGHAGANHAQFVEWGGYNEDGTSWGWDDERAGWGSETVHDMLVNYRVSAFFHGHDHQYAYEKRDGVVYQAVPSAGFTTGFGLYNTGEGYTIRAESSPGHLKVTVGPAQTTVDYIKTSATSPIYSYNITPRPVCYALTIGHTGNGSNPSASPSNSEGCPIGKYVAGANITLSGAVPDSGWQISGWSGTDDDSSTASSNTVTMPASAHTASVIYTQIEYILTINIVGNGTVLPDKPTPYHYNDVVTLTPIADLGWQFTEWSGACTGSSACSVTMDADKSVTATFTQIPNNPPEITEGESTSVIMTDVFTLTLHANDPDGDTLTWSISTQAKHGTAEASGEGESKDIGYIPTAGYTGEDSFVVRVEDTKGGFDTIIVNVTINPAEVLFYQYLPLIIR